MATAAHGVSFQEILLATDFHPGSEKALDFAKALTRQNSAHLMVMHVFEPVAHIAIPEGGWVDDAQVERAEAERLEELGVGLRAEGLNAETVQTYGSVRREICQIAANRHADLVIAATHGRAGLDRLLFGSHAEDVAHHSAVPVLLIGPRVAKLENQSWKIAQMICAVPAHPEGAETVVFAFDLARSRGAKCRVISLRTPDESARCGEETILMDRVRELDPSSDHDFPDPIRYASAAWDRAILDFAVAQRADLVVLEIERRWFNETHLHRDLLAHLLSEAHCPVLAIPAARG